MAKLNKKALKDMGIDANNPTTGGMNPAWYLRGYCPLCVEAAGKKYHVERPAEHVLSFANYRFHFCSYHLTTLRSMVTDVIEDAREEAAKEAYNYSNKCPVCGESNERVVFSEAGIGTVEEYYNCDQCGYAEAMSYSPTVIFFRHGNFKERIRRFFVRLKHWKKALRVRLDDSFNAKAGKHL